MKICYTIFITLITGLFAFSQQKQDDYIIHPEKFKVSEISLIWGISLVNKEFASREDFLSLAPQSKLLQQNLDGYSNSVFSVQTNTNLNSIYAINLGISFPNKTKTNYNYNKTLRIGISGYNYSPLSASFFKETRVPYDTLSSGLSGQTIYIDSVYTHTLDANYNTANLKLDINFTYKRNPHKRFTAYGGIGLNMGFSYNSNTIITDTKIRQTQSSGLYYNPLANQQSQVVTEKFRNKGGYSATVYIPFGLDFRIGNKNEFWRQFHILYEMRPGLDFLNIPSYGKYNKTFSPFMFGIRACFD